MPKDKKHILIVEDEKKIARFLQIELEHTGFQVSIETNGIAAQNKIISNLYDLILLDVMLPGLDGFELCRRIRERFDIPIIMVTAKDKVRDKVEGLDIGADDYITKPFAIPELLARIRNVMRKHAGMVKEATEESVKVKNLLLNFRTREVYVNEHIVSLTKKEYDLLEFLVKNKGRVISREKIVQVIWGYEYMGDTNVVDVYIRYLRSKLDDKFEEKYIHTIRGVGYVVKE
jgi:DNA-binding response OmpR family regulator